MCIYEQTEGSSCIIEQAKMSTMLSNEVQTLSSDFLRKQCYSWL